MKTIIATGSALVAFGLLEANAFQLDVGSLETNTDQDAPASWFGVSIEVNGNGTVTYNFANKTATGNNTKISTIYLGTDGGTPNDLSDGFYGFFVNGTVVISDIGTTDYKVVWNPSSGGPISSKAGWEIQATGDPKTGNDSSLINPGESLSLTFTLKNAATTEQQLIDAFNSNPQQLGVAFHVQAITGGFSEWYEAVPRQNIPVPDGGSTVALIGLGLFGLGAFRRSVAA